MHETIPLMIRTAKRHSLALPCGMSKNNGCENASGAQIRVGSVHGGFMLSFSFHIVLCCAVNNVIRGVLDSKKILRSKKCKEKKGQQTVHL